MPISVRSRGDIRILELQGDFTLGRQISRPLDLQGRPMDNLGEVIDDLLARGNVRLIMDLRGVKFMDSAGLGELIACRQKTVEHGGDIVLVSPRRQVKDLLVITLLSDVFHICEDEEEAVALFASP
jgi:anti-sigma B factor antagonist